jgi:alkanesulfonate monooxygenase SsuD/methylene tetrahydromethanopterin reductase-like flavin-dependent oxidoreductase (luciferase family)
VKLGIGLPESLPYGLDRTLLLDWARLADSAGFHTIAVRDRPNYDMWDPLLTLSAVAAVTERARLATTVLQLPIRNAVMVAKQAAVIDRLSDGRFDLGIGLGSRQDDYAVYGATMEHRITRYRHQVAEIRALWKTAHQTTTRAFGPVGPAPVQEPGPPIWLGALPTNEAGLRRAVELGDGYVFGSAAEPEAMAPVVRKVREWAKEAGKYWFTINRIAQVAVGSRRALDEAIIQTKRYYPGGTPRPIEDMIKHGDPETIGAWVRRNAEVGLDLTILMPVVPDIGQVEQLADSVLPDYR